MSPRQHDEQAPAGVVLQPPAAAETALLSTEHQLQPDSNATSLPQGSVAPQTSSLAANGLAVGYPVIKAGTSVSLSIGRQNTTSVLPPPFPQLPATSAKGPSSLFTNPPAGTRMKVLVNPATDSVDVTIPAAAFSSVPQTLLSIVLLVVSLSTTLFFLFFLSKLPWVLWTVICPIFPAGVLCFWFGLDMLTAEERFVADSDQFWLHQSSLGRSSCTQGSRKEISHVALVYSTSEEGPTSCAGIIGQGAMEHSFGDKLSEKCKIWLFHRLSKFLRVPLLRTTS